MIFAKRVPAGLLALMCAAAWSVGPAHADDRLDAVIGGDHRTPALSVRDAHRRPAETLRFFGLQPGQTVVEVSPGGDGWYTEILAPYLRGNGTLYAAHFNPDSEIAYFRDARQQFMAKLAAAPHLYDGVVVTTLDLPQHRDIAPPGSADLVLTFRNLHSWYNRNGGDAGVLDAFRAFHTALKPGGTLGVVHHRLPYGRPVSDQGKSGYLLQAEVIRIAEAAGFELVGISNLNANPRDTADHPEGVWTLPPALRLGDQDRAKYIAIGESDRMTLKFRKTP